MSEHWNSAQIETVNLQSVKQYWKAIEGAYTPSHWSLEDYLVRLQLVWKCLFACIPYSPYKYASLQSSFLRNISIYTVTFSKCNGGLFADLLEGAHVHIVPALCTTVLYWTTAIFHMSTALEYTVLYLHATPHLCLHSCTSFVAYSGKIHDSVKIAC